MNSEGDTSLEMSDEDLMIAHREGNAEALGALIARYATPLLSYLSRMIGERGQAEDLFQETFMRVHAKAWSFRSDGRFKPWLFTIATRLAIDAIRRRGRRPALVSLDGDPDCPGIGPDPAHAPASNPGSDMIRAELKEQVRQAVDSLPERQRAALVLAHFQGLGYDEVAKVMSCSVSTVKTHMARAIRTLARLLPDPESEAI